MSSWASKVLGLLSLCGNSDLIHNGTWSYHGLVTHKHDPWAICPKTDAFVLQDKYLTDERTKFSCTRQHYRRAVYQTPGCQLLPIESSLKMLRDVSASIAYVGDSLSAQLYLSALCTSEHYTRPTFPLLSFYHDLFLRSDVPCDAQCSNSTYAQLQSGLKDPCWNCKDGIKKNNDIYMRNESLWHHQVVTKGVSALVVGSGAWYNMYQGLMDSATEYNATMYIMGPLFQRLKQDHGIEVFWLGLPPHNVDVNTMNVTDYGYEWAHFEEKNAIAKHALKAFGVTFIDTHELLHRRKRIDPRISPDGLHWW